jgi:hypothetical protein
MASEGLSALTRVLKEQADNPPMNDKHIRHCYLAALNLITKDEHPLSHLLGEMVTARLDTSEEHLVNLLLRAIQYAELWWLENSQYPNHLNNVEAWESEIGNILGRHYDKMRKILLERDTGTTLYQRYIGPRGILASLFPSCSVAVADLGCGGMHGIIGLKHNEPFQSLQTDETPDKIFTSWIDFPMGVSEGLGIDKYDPFDEEAVRWRVACSHYPGEFDQMPNYLKFERRMMNLNGVRFVSGDIVQLDTLGIGPNSFDAVIISTTLYQIPDPKLQERVFDGVRRILRSSGVIVVNDFATVDFNSPDRLRLRGTSWFRKEGGYRTFVCLGETDWKFMEVLKFDNGRCRSVWPGASFDEFVNICNNRLRGGVI